RSGWAELVNETMRRTLVILALLLCPYFMPAIVAAQEVTTQKDGVVQSTFDSGGVPIRYLVTGQEDGEPVVLIHGFAGNIERQWGPVIAALTNDFKIIGLDCRGHGKSGKPHAP